ncbi:MAG: PPC domain-containing protein, partial [Chloroflexota bacterium]
ERSVELSRETQTRAGESIAYVTLPQTGWYLVEASGGEDTGGTGSASGGGFDLYATRLAAAVLQVGQQASGTFTAEAPSISYIVNVRIGDVITVTMFTTDATGAVQPQLELLDLSLNTVDRSTGERFVTLRTPIPRSSPYIVRVTDLAGSATPGVSGGFNLRVTSTPNRNFTAQAVAYNNQYKGTISDETPLNFYRFSGKTGELVTISMASASVAEAGASLGASDLNAYLILMDNDLNELASNDDVSTGRDARITQFRLPKDGEYVILATRSGLAGGRTTGGYDLAITAGEISLNGGAFTATLRWTGRADLNLFVRDPSGRTVSWSSPQIPDGGTLQIDSNTRCETPSDQPVEHATWSALISGDYEVWAWYEDGCGVNISTEFTLDVTVNGAGLPQIQERLQRGQRYGVGLRVTADGQGFVVDPGAITTPSAQQRASEGGDLVIRYGETLNGTISSEVYALFYQFSGTEGDTIAIRVERMSGDLDPILVLRDAGDTPLPGGANDDADETTRDARLTYTLPATGQYVIAVTRFGVRDGTTTGDFQVSLTAGG